MSEKNEVFDLLKTLMDNWYYDVELLEYETESDGKSGTMAISWNFQEE